MRDGGRTVAVGTVFLRGTGSAGNGIKDLGFGGKRDVDASCRVVCGSKLTVPSRSLEEPSSSDARSSSTCCSSISLSLRIMSSWELAPSSASKNSCEPTESMLSRETVDIGIGIRLCLLSAMSAANSATTESRSRSSAMQCSCILCSCWSFEG